MVTRLVDQKGLDILTEALPDIMALGLQLVVLGTGEEKYQLSADRGSGRSIPGRCAFCSSTTKRWPRRIYAGCDLFLMPSRYEPCGLGQLIALRYGSVPVVRKTGGLSDTVAGLQPEDRPGHRVSCSRTIPRKRSDRSARPGDRAVPATRRNGRP